MMVTMGSRERASILFSGGSDSTLAAAIMCEDFSDVTLLTYYHRGIVSWENSRINAARLIDRYGQDRVRHYALDIEEIMREIYCEPYIGDLLRYRGYMSANICSACQLAMHVCTIIHGLNNGVSNACDGYKREKHHIYPFMSEVGIAETGRLYRRFGMGYSTPVYDIKRTDWRLFDMGLTDRRDVKFPDRDIAFKTQHHCPAGTLVNAYLLGYCIPRYGEKRVLATGLGYWREKITSAESIIKQHKGDGSSLEWHEIQYRESS